MPAIIMGSGTAGTNATSGTGKTWLDSNNPASAIGTLTLFKFVINDSLTGIKVGTWYNSGANKWTPRSIQAIADQAGAGKIEKSVVVNLAVQVGDIIGLWFTGGIYWYIDPGAGALWYNGDGTAGEQTYSAAWSAALYAEGATAGGAKIVMGQSKRLLELGLI